MVGVTVHLAMSLVLEQASLELFDSTATRTKGLFQIMLT